MKKGREGDMSEDVPAFQALPGVTPENSAFIDLYYDPSVTFIWGNTLSFSINDGQMRLSAGQSVRIAVPPGPVRVVVQVLTLSFICLWVAEQDTAGRARNARPPLLQAMNDSAPTSHQRGRG